jgi:hypothetical protein
MNELQKFASVHKDFLWWVPDITKVDESGIFEATLTHGTMEDKKELLSIIGEKAFKRNFRMITQGRRSQHLEPRTISYWKLYLSKDHA